MSKRMLLSLCAGLALLGVLASTGCSKEPTPVTEQPATEQPASEQPAEQPTEQPVPPEFPVADVSELTAEDLVVGTGTEARAGSTASVHYTGWLTDGTKFDSSLDSGQPFEFQVGGGRVIEGWDLGVAGMKVGGVRRLIIPPAMGYGEAGAGGVIPPNATLVFDVELLAVN